MDFGEFLVVSVIGWIERDMIELKIYFLICVIAIMVIILMGIGCVGG